VRLPTFLRTRRSLLAEIEALTAANRKLTEELDTAQIVAWVRRNPDHPPKALVLPESAVSAVQARHPVHPGRHRVEAQPTEVHPRAQRAK
jgi:hypothetical protein